MRMNDDLTIDLVLRRRMGEGTMMDRGVLDLRMAGDCRLREEGGLGVARRWIGLVLQANYLAL